MTAAATILVAAAPAQALYKLDSERFGFEATGNLRLFAGFLHLPDLPGASDDGLAGGVGRLILKGALGPHLDYDFHGYLDLGRAPGSGAIGGTFSTAGSFVTPYRTSHLAWTFWSSSGASGQLAGTLGVDRASLHGRFGPVDITAGRFPLNDSVAHLFTPNDFFAPFSATAINKAYKPGVDALRVTFALGQLSALEVRGVLGEGSGDRPRWAESSLTLRASTVIAGFDAALVAGKLAERWVAGGTVQGSVGPIDLRAEGHAGVADRSGDGSGFTAPLPSSGCAAESRVHGRVAAGAGWRGTWHNAFLDAEYAFYSDGTSDPSCFAARLARRFPDDLPLLGRHYVGAAGGLEIIPILRASVLAMVNAGDGSGLAVGTLAWDASDESAVSLGLMVPWGARIEGITPRSELGLYPLTLFVESRFFF